MKFLYGELRTLYLSSQVSLELEGTARGDLLCRTSRSYGEVEVPSYPKGAHKRV